jgi:type II secretory pathway pseudopilin PulG
MKKNNKGFFLAETIVVIALVTTVMAFVYPNVSKLNENYNNRTKYYDQTEDLYALKAIYDAMEHTDSGKTYTYTENSEVYNLNKFDVHITDCNDVDNKCTPDSRGTKTFGLTKITDIGSFGATGINGLDKLYIASYMANLSDSNYNFNKYLKRLRKSTNDPSAYRLIGIFKENNETRYASIKIDNPNPNRTSNLGE